MLSNRLCDNLTTVFVCAWPRRKTGWKPRGSNVNGSTSPLPALSSSACETIRLSRATRLRKREDASCGFLHSASELKLTGETPVANLGHAITPTVDRNG